MILGRSEPGEDGSKPPWDTAPERSGVCPAAEIHSPGERDEMCRRKPGSRAFQHSWDVEEELKTVSRVFPNTDSANKSGERTYSGTREAEVHERQPERPLRLARSLLAL